VGRWVLEAVALSGQLHAADRAEQAHEDDQDDGQRQRSSSSYRAAKTRKTNNHRQHEGGQRGVARLELKVGELSPVVGVSSWAICCTSAAGTSDCSGATRSSP